MKVCLCGSTRFMDQYQEANRRLTLAGHIVYSVAAVSTGNHSEISHDEKLMLDAVHLKKIAESDAIMIVGRQEDGSIYIGDSTRREITFARVWGKEVFFFEPGEKVSGPSDDFVKDIEGAAETEAARESRHAEAEARRREFMERLQAGGSRVVLAGADGLPLDNLSGDRPEEISPN